LESTPRNWLHLRDPGFRKYLTWRSIMSGLLYWTVDCYDFNPGAWGRWTERGGGKVTPCVPATS